MSDEPRNTKSMKHDETEEVKEVIIWLLHGLSMNCGPLCFISSVTVTLTFTSASQAASNVGPYGLFWQPALVCYLSTLYLCLLIGQIKMLLSSARSKGLMASVQL